MRLRLRRRARLARAGDPAVSDSEALAGAEAAALRAQAELTHTGGRAKMQ